jgi:hypothetical protein
MQVLVPDAVPLLLNIKWFAPNTSDRVAPVRAGEGQTDTHQHNLLCISSIVMLHVPLLLQLDPNPDLPSLSS